MGHTHHDHEPGQVPPEIQRRLLFAVAPFALATIVGLVLFWPPAEGTANPRLRQPVLFKATVIRSVEHDCGELMQRGSFECFSITARLDEGPDEGTSIEFQYTGGSGTRAIQEDDGLLLASSPGPEGETAYFFADYQRSGSLLLLGILFAAVVVVLSRWRGVAALGGLVVSILVLVNFLLPAILAGSSPIAVSIVGAAAIMFVSLYLAHGFNARTTTAVLGTLTSLVITGILALIFVEITRFSGFASEEATFLQISAQNVNLRGLLLGGIIIGALGVLDDVTITQASAVWELHIANPTYRFRELYRSAVRIGRDHIASTVNTLVLAYVGASLPLLILFIAVNRPLGSIITSEVVAEEIVRTLVGSIGLVASVPITTALAAVTVSGDYPRFPRFGKPMDDAGNNDPEAEDWAPPRAEQEWRDG